VVAVGAAIGLVALLGTQAVLPLADRWSIREQTLAARLEEQSRLRAVVASESGLRAAVAAERGAGRETGALLLAGATPALAASALQVLLRRYAEESQIQLDRVDVAGQPKPDRPGLLAIPVVLQGQGDIYGLVDLLFRLQHGERLLVTDELTVNASFDRAGFDPSESDAPSKQKLLSWTVRAHGLYPAPSAARAGGTARPEAAS
jgi:hypothetical protein